MRHIFSAVMGRFSLGILVLGLVLCVPVDVFAQSAAADSGLETFAKILAHIVNFLTFISLMMLNWGGQLFGTEFITSPGIEESLRPLWILIRNLVNLSFVLILVYLVFANMINAFTGGGNWTIKEKLPRIIFAMIAINFSFLVMKVLIDAVNVGSVVILSIADTALESVVVNSDTNETANLNSLQNIMEQPVEGCSMPGGDTCKVYEAVNKTFCKEDNINHSECIFRLNPDSWQGSYNLDSASNQTARNLMLAFGTHLQHLEKLPLLPAQISKSTGTAGGFLAIIDNVLFSSIMALAYIIAIGAVFIALISRVFVLWFAMIFSPALMAMMIMGIGDSKQWVDKFVTHLIMPLKISAAFTFGFIMISALAAWEVNILFENPGGVSLIDAGPSLRQFFDNEYGFLWQILTIILFWKAAFWALEGSVAETITNQIKEKTEATGKFALKAGLMDRELIPSLVGGNEKGLTLRDIKSLPRQAVTNYENTQTRMSRDRIRKHHLTDQFFSDDEMTQKLERNRNAFNTKLETAESGKEMATAFMNAIDKFNPAMANMYQLMGQDLLRSEAAKQLSPEARKALENMTAQDWEKQENVARLLNQIELSNSNNNDVQGVEKIMETLSEGNATSTNDGSSLQGVVIDSSKVDMDNDKNTGIAKISKNGVGEIKGSTIDFSFTKNNGVIDSVTIERDNARIHSEFEKSVIDQESTMIEILEGLGVDDPESYERVVESDGRVVYKKRKDSE